MLRTESSPKTVFLKDYQPPAFLMDSVELNFDLYEDHAVVKSRIEIRRNADAPPQEDSLSLHGEELKLMELKLNGSLLNPDQYSLTPEFLVIKKVPTEFTLEVVTRIEPQNNLALEGLYKTGGMFCTQCEAEGFRKITYFLDRPDVMTTYKVRIEGDKSKYPILLSNGNCIEKGDLSNGRHMAVWHDPFKKPSYLFALVAGDLGVIEDEFITMSGRRVKLQIFARHGVQERCQFAMQSLKDSMRWDEERFGREYDLDIFMIVVADDFNGGAMENKGLNIFNSSYVLANSQTATDEDYLGVYAVIGHEYFHNWTGNRITCRDWFQLSLKEGLTVFRDQEFSADYAAREVRRIDDVIRLRGFQFVEDAGPMAHPIRPQSYIAINNFYTLTVYEKGAEVIRMQQTLLGREGFRKGMDLYFEKYDGQAVTTDDFVSAMEAANGADLKQFRRWYEQAGTPLVEVRALFDADQKTYRLIFTQSCKPTPGQSEKLPFHIPIAMGLLNSKGEELKLQISGGPVLIEREGRTAVLQIREKEQEFIFSGLDEKPIPSLLRDFSAPIRLQYNYSDSELAFLLAHDSNAFTRWEAAQVLVTREVQRKVADPAHSISQQLIESFAKVVSDTQMDLAFKSVLLTLPTESYLAQFFTPVDPLAIHNARVWVGTEIVNKIRSALIDIVTQLRKQETNEISPIGFARRALKIAALQLLNYSKDQNARELALKVYQEAKNMTDELGALEALNRHDSPERDEALKVFYKKWKGEALVMDKWFELQSTACLESALDRIPVLAQDPEFDENNPNKLYALYRYFGAFNSVAFHSLSGRGYRLLADAVIQVDPRNPQVAARIVSSFNSWRQLDSPRQQLIKPELQRILATPKLSTNVFEIVSKALEN